MDLYALKVLSSTGSGNYSAIISAIDWSINNNIQVLNLSLGSSGDPGTTVRQAFDRAQAAGLVVVASAGNAGSGADTVSFPAKYESVIAVASTTSTDARSSFSSTGPAVELAAPGSSIYSTYPGGGPPPTPPTFDPPSNLTGTALSSTVSLTWQDNSTDEDGFQLTYGSGKGRSFSWQPPVGIPADTTSWTLSLPDETYRFRIRAVRGAEVTDWSNEISLKVSGSSGGGGGGGKGGGKK